MFLISICDIILNPFKHGNSELLLLNIGILALSVYTLEFWPFFINTGILILSIHTLELWPYFLHIGITPYPSKHLNSGPISLITGILTLFLQTLEFLSYPSTGSNEYLASSFQTLEFWLIIYTHWFSDVILQNAGILILSF